MLLVSYGEKKLLLTGSRPEVCDVQPKNPALAGFNRWGPAAAEVQPVCCQVSKSDVFISRHLPQGRSGYLHPQALYLLVKVSFTVWNKAPCRSLSPDMAKALFLRSILLCGFQECGQGLETP